MEINGEEKYTGWVNKNFNYLKPR